ncbi:electron transporter RnfD [Candidatus Aerophobetes bacterium]|uniref:Ion-translocating oxidoreductase complex subunit D n=1 Tax=Aerophobetes bacterium TaxID=2030807 RepID=A0A662D6E6_UNCAE|nr:MAG: electron transporter RnfD [Candidatus Aerophobetes bacterium]
MEKVLFLSPSPHIKDRMDVSRLMWDVIFSLLPAVGFSVYFFRFKAVELYLTCIFFSVLSECLFLKLRRRELPKEPSAILTGLLLAMVLPPSIPLWAAALGAIFAIIFGKQIFGGLGYNIFNPALMGRAFLMATFPVLMTTWINPFTLDVVTSATPLGLLKFHHQLTPLWSLFWGNVAGSLGETSAFALLVGAVYLLVKRCIDWRIPLFYLLTVLVFSSVTFLLNPAYGSPLFHLLAGGLILGAFFMATDPVTTPISKLGRIIFGTGAGVLVMVIRLWGGYPEGVMFSIIFMNAITPVLNRYIKPKSFGGKRS